MQEVQDPYDDTVYIIEWIQLLGDAEDYRMVRRPD
jgi:hypothetical protein